MLSETYLHFCIRPAWYFNYHVEHILICINWNIMKSRYILSFFIFEDNVVIEGEGHGMLLTAKATHLAGDEQPPLPCYRVTSPHMVPKTRRDPCACALCELELAQREALRAAFNWALALVPTPPPPGPHRACLNVSWFHFSPFLYFKSCNNYFWSCDIAINIFVDQYYLFQIILPINY